MWLSMIAIGWVAESWEKFMTAGMGIRRRFWSKLHPWQVFQGDVRALRDYLAAESEYADGIRMLDEDGGWALIDVRADS